MKQLSMEAIRESVLHDETWVGDSSALKLTKQRLISMTNSVLPVLIYGKKGTGKKVAAKMLHDYDKGVNSPFITINCQKSERSPLWQRIEEGWRKAERGSLFISNIDSLTEEESSNLRSFLSAIDMFESAQTVRLITSTRQLPTHQSESMLEHIFIEWMQYHSFTIELPTLEERAEDIEDLIRHYQQQIPAIGRLRIGSSALTLLKQYQWPENVFHLKHCLEILASQRHASNITREILLDDFPYMAPSETSDQSNHKSEGSFQSVYRFKKPENGIQENSLIDLLANNEPIGNSVSRIVCNPILEKAIAYLYNNFTQPISLDELANYVCISSSHLSYLFKTSLGLSFKQTLLLLRIVEAMKLLTENPNRQVTQVCDDVGFCDLSFFIRKFKATVGISPGAYRNQYGHVKASPELLKVEEALAHPLLQFPIRH